MSSSNMSIIEVLIVLSQPSLALVSNSTYNLMRFALLTNGPYIYL